MYFLDSHLPVRKMISRCIVQITCQRIQKQGFQNRVKSFAESILASTSLIQSVVLSQEHRLIYQFISAGNLTFNKIYISKSAVKPTMNVALRQYIILQAPKQIILMPPQAMQLCHFLKKNVTHFCQC